MFPVAVRLPADMLAVVTVPWKIGDVFNTRFPVPVLVVTPVPPLPTPKVP